DTGVNVYHNVFQAPGRGSPADRIASFPGGARELAPASTGSYDARVAADKAFWDSLKVGEFVAFRDNRIVGAISMGSLGDAMNPSSRIVLDDVGHGTGTAGAVALTAPNVDIVMVQVGAASLANGIRWAAEQPWIDVLSISWGTLANAPADALGGDLVDATRAAAAAGKLVIVSAGNEPTLAWTDGNNGPAWVVAVGGADPETRGETSSASKGAEVVSDYSPALPTVNSVDAMEEMYGTSFATPIVAGVAAEALTLVRAVGLSATADQLRTALHQAAEYWDTTDYSVPGYIGTSQPIPVAPTPWVQMGWGYLNVEHIGPVAGALAGNAPPAKDAAAVAYMDAQMAARRAFWGS
ncbi:MAG TPA: S8/S53 family peptidase, partial [Candidatus Thermoplasmatota archaeon]|nr:S8/S53 family peptidase [Candidatus Thermoplasmatota archaeon]